MVTSDLVGLVNDFGADYILTDRKELLSANDLDCPVVSTLTDCSTSMPDSDVIRTRWVLATSGTTGKPKLVSHSLGGLTRTSKRNSPNTQILYN